MKLNLSLREFKSNHSKKKHQILFRARSCNQYYKVENLFRFLLAEKNSFIFESVEKGTIKGRYTIIVPFSTDSKIKLFFSAKRNLNKFSTL